MNTPLRINKLCYTFDYAKLEAFYQVFQLVTDDNYFLWGSYMLDTPILCSRVRSLAYEGGRNIYLLLDKAADNRERLVQALADLEDFPSIRISGPEALSAVPRHSLCQLLLNSLSGYRGSLKASNITGHLYCYRSQWLKYRTSGQERYIAQVPALEIKVDREDRLSLRVRTFTSTRVRELRQLIQKEKRPLAPIYALGANFTLHRKLAGEEGEGFLQRQLRGKKSSIPFLDLGSYGRFQQSKLGVLAELLDRFQEEFSQQVQLEWDSIEAYTALETRSCGKMLQENMALIKDYLARRQVKIVDGIGDVASRGHCEKLAVILQKDYGCQARLGKRLAKGALNIRLIHNKDYYKEGERDPHSTVPAGVAVQHITWEDFKPDQAGAVRNVLLQLLIKEDLQQQKFSLYQWPALAMEGKTAFLAPFSSEKGEEHYLCMEVYPDGSFSLAEKKPQLLGTDEYRDCLNVFLEDDWKKTVRGVIKFPSGDINVIRETQLFTLPELAPLQKKLHKGETRLRNKDSRHSLLESLLDIKAFYKDGSLYYFAGVIGAGMRSQLPWAALVRKVEAYGGGSLQFERLLPLLNVPFVRLGQLTVIPFPFKYLREYGATLGWQER